LTRHTTQQLLIFCALLSSADGPDNKKPRHGSLRSGGVSLMIDGDSDDEEFAEHEAADEPQSAKTKTSNRTCTDDVRWATTCSRELL
jgi:hypothetical protein